MKNKFGKPKARRLDQMAVAEFLKSINFETDKISQEWRHLIAFGRYDSKPAVFKLATTQITGQKTQNEFNFNEAVHLSPVESRPNFTVPENYVSGYYGKLFYFICEFFEGLPLALRESKDMSRVSSRIAQIAMATFELNNLPIPADCAFAQPKKKPSNKYSSSQRLLHSASEWASQVPRDLTAYLDVIKKTGEIRTCVGHGDFVVRQMYDVGGKIGVIDGEHAGYRGPLYYDVAQFYIRLCSDNDAEELAREYLLEYKKLLSADDQKIFWTELKPLLIQRYIGDLWGAKNNPEKLDERRGFGERILYDKVL